MIESEIVLYMQEDYFICGRVKDEWVKKYVDLMMQRPNIECIHLTDQAVEPAAESPDGNRLLRVKQGQRYQVSCQAALWRKSALRKYLRRHESAWEFEEFGSKRAAIQKANFYVVDKSWVKRNDFELIPYIFTGIVQGKWNTDVLPLFKSQDISVDFLERGFIEHAKKKPLKARLKSKVLRVPLLIRSSAELLKMKLLLQARG